MVEYVEKTRVLGRAFPDPHSPPICSQSLPHHSHRCGHDFHLLWCCAPEHSHQWYDKEACLVPLNGLFFVVRSLSPTLLSHVPIRRPWPVYPPSLVAVSPERSQSHEDRGFTTLKKGHRVNDGLVLRYPDTFKLLPTTGYFSGAVPSVAVLDW